MTKKKDSKVDQDNLSELEEVQDNIEQPEEESDLEEVEPSAEEKISSLEDQMMRLQAEMINTRKSAQNDIARARIFGLESFMKDLLSVIDNLFRNLDFKTEENTIPADGYKLILRELCKYHLFQLYLMKLMTSELEQQILLRKKLSLMRKRFIQKARILPLSERK